MKKIVAVFIVASVLMSCATAVCIDSAISEAKILLSQKMPISSKIAVLNFISNDETTSYFILGKMLSKLSESNDFVIIDRDAIEDLQDTLNFTLSQNINKNLQLSIGRELGAQIIISGTVSGVKDRSVFVIQALEVASKKIVASYKIKVKEYQTFYESTNSDELIYGIGSAKAASLNMSMTMAQSRARADISRKVNTIIETSRNETTTTSNVELSNSRTLEIFFGEDGTVWVIAAVNKKDAIERKIDEN